MDLLHHFQLSSVKNYEEQRIDVLVAAFSLLNQRDFLLYGGQSNGSCNFEPAFSSHKHGKQNSLCVKAFFDLSWLVLLTVHSISPI